MTAEPDGGSIKSVLVENRVFPPPPEFARQAHISSLAQYQQMWQRAKDDDLLLGNTIAAVIPVECLQRR